MKKEKVYTAGHSHRSVIPTTSEAEAGGTQFQGPEEVQNMNNLPRPPSQNNKKEGWGYNSVLPRFNL